jgi:peptidoglycan/LPS O-acetylase OafA/YrhL
MSSSAVVVNDPIQLRPTVQVTIPAKRASQYIPQLDGIRGIAVLVVMFQHVWGHWSVLFTNGIVEQVAKRGWIGVDVFFVLSGFLITGILLRATSKGRALTSFYLRRAVRIWPLYFLLLALVCVATHLLHQPYPIAPFFLFVQNFLPEFPKPSFFDQTWSLCVEEHFYLVWPLLVLFVPRRWLPALLGIVIAGSPILRLHVLHSAISTKLLYTSTQYRLDGIALGSLLALLVAAPNTTKDQILRFGRWVFMAALPLTVWCFSTLGRDDLGFRSPFLYTLVSVLAMGLVAMTISKDAGLAYNVLASKVLRYIGRISYGLYMIHPFVFGAMRQHVADIRGPLLAIPISFALAAVSWHFYESRLLASMKR